MRVLVGAWALCPPAGFAPQSGFDLDAYIAAPWFIQQQAATSYLPTSQNRCVSAAYRKAKSFWGYDVAVHNVAYDVAPPHAVHDSGSKICAKIVNATDGELKVAPCFLPTSAAGAYWVVHFDDAKGVAVVSGGPPTVPSHGKCKNDPSKTNGAGFWIFTRQQARDGALVAATRAVAESQGFDLSVLNDVDQTDCPPVPASDVAETSPCCTGACATPGEAKYYSIAASKLGVPHCGETCLNPSKYGLFHLFERNLTKASGDSPCAGFGYAAYDSTVTHGFGILKITLDLYDAPRPVLHV